MSASTVFLICGAGARAPEWKVGGITPLERKLREAARRGAVRAIVACDGTLPRAPVGIAIERARPGSPPPPGAVVVEVDEIAGVRVASAADAARAEEALLRGLPKSFQGPIDALVNRHVSLRITRVLCRTSITPNQVTVIALAIGLVAAALLAIGRGDGVLYAAAVLLFFQSVFDSCDGELARLRIEFSAIGQWLDNIGDDLVDGALTIALGLAAGGALATLGLCAAAGRVFTQLSLYREVRRLGGDFNDFRWWFERGVATTDEVYDRASPLTHLRAIGRRDVYVFAWAVLVGLSPVWPSGLSIAASYAVAVSFGYVALTVLHLSLGRRTAPR